MPTKTKTPAALQTLREADPRPGDHLLLVAENTVLRVTRRSAKTVSADIVGGTGYYRLPWGMRVPAQVRRATKAEVADATPAAADLPPALSGWVAYPPTAHGHGREGIRTSQAFRACGHTGTIHDDGDGGSDRVEWAKGVDRRQADADVRAALDRVPAQVLGAGAQWATFEPLGLVLDWLATARAAGVALQDHIRWAFQTSAEAKAEAKAKADREAREAEACKAYVDAMRPVASVDCCEVLTILDHPERARTWDRPSLLIRSSDGRELRVSRHDASGVRALLAFLGAELPE